MGLPSVVSKNEYHGVFAVYLNEEEERDGGLWVSTMQVAILLSSLGA